MEKNMLKFNEKFTKNYDEDSDKGYILEIDVKYPKHLQFSYLGNISHYDLLFLPEKRKLIKSKILYVIYLITKTMLFI